MSRGSMTPPALFRPEDSVRDPRSEGDWCSGELGVVLGQRAFGGDQGSVSSAWVSQKRRKALVWKESADN